MSDSVPQAASAADADRPVASSAAAATAGEVFFRADPALWLLGVKTRNRRGGLIATSVMQASIVPDAPRVIVGLSKQHLTESLVAEAGTFTLHLLEQSQTAAVELFGLHSGRDVDKWANVAGARQSADGIVYPDTVGVLFCRVETVWETGDRRVYLAAVERSECRDAEPLRLQTFLAAASDDVRQALREQLTADARTDAAAIAEWRNAHRVVGDAQPTNDANCGSAI